VNLGRSTAYAALEADARGRKGAWDRHFVPSCLRAFPLHSPVPPDELIPEPSCPLEPYRKAVRAEGPSFRALLWYNREYQLKRFEVIAQEADLAGRVIADLGCGRADLLSYLHGTGIRYGRYIGVDGVGEMAEFSRRRAAQEKLPEARFLHADFSSDPDLFARLARDHGADTFVFSGSLNTFEEPAAREVLARAFSHLPSGRRGGSGAGGGSGGRGGGLLIFNFLSDRGATPDDPPGPARRFDTAAMAAWALDNTPSMALRTDYLAGHDATIVMHKAGPDSGRP
jgi:SAM-dependent methyltransferase